MSDFGRVGKIVVPPAPPSITMSSWSIFMIVAPSDNEFIRRGMPGWRLTLCLAGAGTWSGPDPVVAPGKLIPVDILDSAALIEWYD